MPRVGRIVIPGSPHHVTQRGNNRQDVFFVDDDRREYLAILTQQCRRFGLTLEGYCLMTNHVHLIVVPQEECSLAQAIGRTHWLYTQHVNNLHGRSGHLWQNRFFSCGLDDEHFWAAMAYIERNPVVAKLVPKAWLYPWSSAAAHCDGVSAVSTNPFNALNLKQWRHRLANGITWQEALTQAQDGKVVERLRNCTSRGRPLASDRFLAHLETTLGRRLRPLPVGRPRKPIK